MSLPASPLKFRYAFVLTYGRSGSTLLQGILNLIPGACIRGENGGVLLRLYSAWETVERNKVAFGFDRLRPTNPWYGIEKADVDGFGRALAAAFEANVLAPPPDATLIGFKEIRYFPHMLPDIDPMLAFIRRFFPGSCFVVLTRDLAATGRSVEAVKMDIAPDQIAASDRRLRELGARGGDIFHVHYDDFAQNAAALRPLFDFLGAPFEIEAVEAALRTPHSVFTESEPPPPPPVATPG